MANERDIISGTVYTTHEKKICVTLADDTSIVTLADDTSILIFFLVPYAFQTKESLQSHTYKVQKGASMFSLISKKSQMLKAVGPDLHPLNILLTGVEYSASTFTQL